MKATQKTNTIIASISTTKKWGKANFFKLWLDFLQPLHHLQPRESEVLAILLQKRYELSLTINDDIKLDKLLFSEEIKQELQSRLSMGRQQYNPIISKFRKLGIINKKTINKKYLPNISFGANECRLILQFKITDES